MYNQFLDLEQIKPSKKSSKAFSTWQKVMINTCFDNLSGRAKSVRCFRQTEFLHSVCALNSYDATRTSRAIIDLSYIIWICIYIYAYYLPSGHCSKEVMNKCQILSVLKHRKGISQETWCQLPLYKMALFEHCSYRCVDIHIFCNWQ